MKKDLTVLKAIIKADYNRHIKKFQTIKEQKDIVLFGDSMMAYFPVTKLNLTKKIHNLGIPGDTTDGLLNRLNQVIRLKPKYVFVNVGLNDLVLTNNTHQKSIENMMLIRHELLEKLHDTKIYFFTLTPINQKDFSHDAYVLKRNKEDIITMNHLMNKHLGDDVINLYQHLSDENHELIRNYTKDGIHVNELGYQYYLKAIKNKTNIDDLK